MVSTATGAAAGLIPGPSLGQILALCIALACLAAAATGAIWSVRNRHRHTGRYWVWAWVGAALACNIVLLLWRGEQLNWDWPLKHRFDTFVLLGGLVCLIGLYIDLWWRWELTGAAFAPLAVLAQLGALTGLQDYIPADGPQPEGPAYLVHVMAFVLAAGCLAVAGVAGGLYLALHRRLRRPDRMLHESTWPSLEALERLNIRAATLGFPLLTIGLWLGMIQIWHEPDRLAWLLDAKVASASIVWLVYAGLLHLQHIPTFRGTRMAWMSVMCTVGLAVTFAISGMAVTRHP